MAAFYSAEGGSAGGCRLAGPRCPAGTVGSGQKGTAGDLWLWIACPLSVRLP